MDSLAAPGGILKEITHMNTTTPAPETDAEHTTVTAEAPNPRRKGRKGPVRNPKIAEALRRKWQDPEYREKQARWAAERRADPTKAWSRRGIFKGHSREESARIRAEAEASAAETMRAMVAAGLVQTETGDDQKAAEALEACLVMMRVPLNQRLRLRAARILLTFTKGKPARRSRVTTESAEAWLREVAAAVA